MTIRIASFNVQNLFDRPKVFNFRDRSVGDNLLARIGEFRKRMRKLTYTAADKSVMFRAFTHDGGTPTTAPLSAYINVREDQHKFWQRQNRRISGVKANGANEWGGSIEFKRAKFSEVGRENTAKVVRAVKADIACIVEADNRPSLKRFDTELLRSKYRYEMLMDGNDSRGIDVGLYSRYPLGNIRTHMFDGSSRSKTFSRDCPEYEVILPDGRPLTILCNHLKSKGYGNQATSNARRKRQAEAIRDILRGYDLRNDLVVVAGDLNDTPDSRPLEPLMRVRNLYDVLALQFPNQPKKRWTYHFRSFEQIDYVLVSRPLRDVFREAGVERRGIYELEDLTTADPDVDDEVEYDTVTHWANSGSDHGAVWADFDLQNA